MALLFTWFSLAAGSAPAKGKLEWTAKEGYRVAPLPVAIEGRTGFTLLSNAAAGIHFTNSISVQRVLERQNLMNGAGVAAGDYDGDGLCDLYFCNKEGSNALYRNRGDWTFEDVTAGADVACADQSSTGATFADLNGDGHLDLLVTSFGGPNACLLNDGKGHFTNITAAAQLLAKGNTTSQALGDLDGDGDLDLYVNNFGIVALLRDGAKFSTKIVNGRPVVQGRYANRLKIVDNLVVEFGEPDVLYLNNGQGLFAPVVWNQVFQDEAGQPMAAPWDFGLAVQIRDINDDGSPDIYVCNDFQTPDRVWLNDGQGRFRAIDKLAVRNMSFACMGVDFADFDRDGHLDYFTLEMFSRDHRRHLQQSSPMRPVSRQIGQIDNREETPRNALYWNRGDGTYAEIAQMSGVAASDWSWTPIFLDVDLDGYEDLLISNGHMYDVNDMDTATTRPARQGLSLQETRKYLLSYPRLDTPKAAFRNRGDLTFEDVSEAWGFNSRQIAQGMALADLDLDGDLDVMMNCLNAPPLVYRNDSPAPRLAVRLQGNPPNTQGIGAKIKVLGGPVIQSQEILCGGRYLSGDDPMRVFAAWHATNEFQIEVTWRSGKKSVIRQAKANFIYEIDEAGAVEIRNPKSLPAGAAQAGEIRNPKAQVQNAEVPTSSDSQFTNHSSPITNHQSPIANPPRAGGTALPDAIPHPPSPIIHPPSSIPHRVTQSFFQDASAMLQHVHHEEAVDDFARQPLLPKLLSQLGPGVVWADCDLDGHDDLIVGSGKNGTLAFYRNEGNGRFSRPTLPALSLPVADDSAGLVAMVSGAGQVSLLVGLSNYEGPATNSPSVMQFAFSGQTAAPAENLPATSWASGPLALADIDGDGDLDLFVGGRVRPGKYPEAASSLFYRNAGGQLQLDGENSPSFQNVGMVSGAVFSDLNGDGNPDLILACEWGPVRIFLNQRGRFKEATEKLGLIQFNGWWNGVSTGDFDGDGRLDIVGSNWGRNSRYESHRAQPLRLYYGDLDGDGTADIVEAYFDPAMGKVVPERALGPMSRGIPKVRQLFSTHRAYAEASVEEIFGESLKSAKLHEANWLESTLFLNRGGHFEARVLPVQAQIAPAFGISVGDLDGDGNEDLFLSQNFFATQPETCRYDGGRGLWLQGDGQGGWTAVRGQESGLAIYGEQRGCALADYDADGRVDLAVTQNGAATRLFHNVGAKPGLRIRLKGAPANPLGVGAQMRLLFGTNSGPVREIHAGGGYWSQDSRVQVMGAHQAPSGIWVRWPGGKTTTADIPSGAREVILDQSGTVQKLR